MHCRLWDRRKGGAMVHLNLVFASCINLFGTCFGEGRGRRFEREEGSRGGEEEGTFCIFVRVIIVSVNLVILDIC